MADAEDRQRWKMSSEQRKEKAFIEGNFKKCECDLIVRKSDSSVQQTDSSEGSRCCCGKKIKEHSKEVYSRWPNGETGTESRSSWDVENCTQSNDGTDAFGEIQFAGRSASESTARYIRLSFKTDPDIILTLIEEHWMRGRKQKPSVVIAVTGGAEDFHMESHIRDAFAKGLSRMTTQSNAWVTTGGQYRGVMKMVGQSLKNVYDDQRNRVPCIGFCQWGFMRDHNEKLVNMNRGRKIATYHALDRTDKTCVSLDPNHTHFIIVDNGIEGKEYGEYELYNKVKEAMRNRWSVPIVTILLGANDRGPVINVTRTLGNNLPVLIMKGAGGVADLLTFALKDVVKRAESEWESAIRGHVLDAFGQNHHEFEFFVADTLDCMKQFRANNKESLLAIFDASDERDAYLGLDFAVLKLLFAHARKNLSAELALEWNRVDILQEAILFQSVDLNEGSTNWEKLMHNALLEEKHEFVRLFIDHTVVDFKRYLDDTELLDLYNKNERGVKALKYICNAVKGTKALKRICKVVKVAKPPPDQETSADGWSSVSPTSSPEPEQEPLNSSWSSDSPAPTPDPEQEPLTSSQESNQEQDPVFSCKEDVEGITNRLLNMAPSGRLTWEEADNSTDSVVVDKKFHLLFIWSLLTQRWKLAEVFWIHGPEPLAAALAAGIIMQEMSDLLKGDDVFEDIRKTLRAQRKAWAARACGLLQACYDSEDVRDEALVKCTAEWWGGQTPLELAVTLKNLEFFANPVVGTVVARVWKGRIQSQISVPKIFLSAVCPLFIPFFIEVKKEAKIPGITETETEINKSKITALYCSPAGKYSLSFTSYILFLGLFSYSLMIKWDSYSPTPYEILTFIWVSSILIEDLYQMFSLARSQSFQRESGTFLVIQVAAFLLYFAGVVLRYVPHNSKDSYPSTFQWARRALSSAIVLFIGRLLEFLFVNKTLGPKLTMIRKMIKDFIAFAAILLVFLLGYGVAVQTLLCPLAQPSWHLLVNVFYVPFFHIYGELFLDLYHGDKDWCVSFEDTVIDINGTTVGGANSYPQNDWFVWILLAIYLVLTILLLLNLLIAIFNNTYTRIENESELLWKFQRYLVVTKFVHKTVLPHPFAWISLLCFYIYRKYTSKEIRSDLCVKKSALRDAGPRSCQYLASIEFLETYSAKGVGESSKEADK